ncbi:MULTISPECIES: methyltransferase domain-containing protein [unclassified Legionella]|uniref:methyltransferase domain-containing protein n=1 Tax=unclassified Legionella TaxID=2622702 RepID=UPI0010551D04|nr:MULTISPECIES: methyltransferase domain-containing protein [unclassified Legionella]MDI9818228.1 methyltransferase domain-containing protein [Legionella sp. PL877]
MTLSLEDEESRFKALRDWFCSTQGKHVGHAFATELASVGECLYGHTLLQLGDCGDNFWLQPLHYTHKWLATPYYNHSSALITSFNKIPIDRNSVDCVIMPLVMEAFSRNNTPIDEIDRILKPMGYVVFWGINPMSLWGLFTRFGHNSFYGKFPVNASSVFHIKRTMLHRGYIQCGLSNFYFIPPVHKKSWIHKLEILNELGKMIRPCPAGFYCLIVQKYEETQPNLLSEKVEEELLDAQRVSLPACRLRNSVDIKK